MKNLSSTVRETLIAKYLQKDKSTNNSKSTDINVLLNRVKLNQKMNSEKDLLFSGCFYRPNSFWYINFLKLRSKFKNYLIQQSFNKSIIKLITNSNKSCTFTELF